MKTETAQSRPKTEKSISLLGRMVRSYLLPHTKILVVAIIMMLISSSMTALFAQLLQPVFDQVLIGKDTHKIWQLAFAVFGCITLRGITTYAHLVLMNNIGQDIVGQLQKELFTHFMVADIAYHQQNPSGGLITRMVSDTAVMRGAVADAITGFGKNTITLILLLGVMFYQNWQLSLFAIVIFPPALIFVSIVGKKIRAVSRRTQDSLSGFSDKLTQAFQGVRQVKVHNQEYAESERMAGVIDSMRTLYKKAVRVGNLTTPVNDLFAGFALMGLIAYGGHAVMSEQMTTGALVSFIGAFLLAYEPMKKLSKMNASLNLGIGAAERIFEILDVPPSIQDKVGTAKLDVKAPTIRFDKVSFAYDNEGDDGINLTAAQKKRHKEITALDKLSFEAPAGKTIALVGPSGGGKSTILNMIPRFFEPQKGAILINDIDIRDVTLASLRAHLSYVPQDVMIFDESVAFNIAYGADSASQKDIEKAAKAAFAHEFIIKMPEQYETKLGERGTKLSGGQRQRIAIARAILRDTPILLLDEATSALDNESESYIQRSLDSLRQNRTTLIVAHRLSTIQNADHIFVIDKGRVAEQGTHESLLKREGLYYTLHKAALKGENYEGIL